MESLQYRIAIIEDDMSFASTLVEVFKSVKVEASLFSSVESFMAVDSSGYGCVISDVRLSGMSGLQF